MSSPEAASGASPSDKPEEPPVDEGLLRKFRHHGILEELEDPEQRRILLEMMRAFEGPEETEEEDGRELYHDALCLLRYCRARKWDLQAAQEMLRRTGRWRRSSNFAGLVSGEYAESMAQENDSGKMYVRGLDRRGRPAIVMRPRNENSSDGEAMVRHLAYCVERAVRCIDRQVREGRLQFALTDPNAGKFVLCVDFGGYGLSNLIPLSVARAVISVLQDHYPERLGQAFIIDAPWILNAFITAVTPFVDPVTMEKVQFLSEVGEARAERMGKYFDLSVLEPDFAGTATAPFESHIFMGCKLGGTEFGLEFNEQLAMSEAEPAAARPAALRDGAADGGFKGHLGNAPMLAPLAFWRVCSDSRVMLLSRRERWRVRELARALSCERDDTVEDHAGLFDDAAALIGHLRARAWAPPRAEASIRATARWRKATGLAAQRSGWFAEAIEKEAALGRMYVRGFDRRGRPVLHVKLCGPYSRRHEDTIRYFVYCIERAVACAGRAFGGGAAEGVAGGEGGLQQARGKFVVLVDFAGYSARHRPKMRTVREAMRVLSDHYPDQLGDVYLLSPPLKVCALWRLLRCAVHPMLSERVALVRGERRRAELLSAVFDPSRLERSVGGQVDAPFDSHTFLHARVDGEVYGAEFEAQAAASGGGEQAADGTAPWDFAAEPEKDRPRRACSLENLCGGSNSSLW